VEDPLADAEPNHGVPDAMAEDGGDPMVAATPSQAEDDTATETRVNLWDPGADTFHLVDDVADDTTAADDSAGTDDVAFSSVREVTTTEAAEEVLRRIVAEAVREELQGALGERITRNVRKLVRREIRLVLAVDELD
jgi:hypothetical protein